MAATSLEDRVAALEAQVARLKAKVDGTTLPNDVWLDSVWGAFANDPGFEEAMRLGREWRESFRPGPDDDLPDEDMLLEADEAEPIADEILIVDADSKPGDRGGPAS